MLGAILIAVGGALMLGGGVMLTAWTSGKSRWFDAGVFDRSGASKTDRQFIDLYFMALVLAPLLGGALMIVVGLRKLL
jgi:hypothetical protein